MCKVRRQMKATNWLCDLWPSFSKHSPHHGAWHSRWLHRVWRPHSLANCASGH